MKLGVFSLSLTVADLSVSSAFYQKLGFTPIGGDPEQGWQILNNADCNIGLFQGMFEKNMLTFNPGWGNGGVTLDDFTDVRELQRKVKEAGITLMTEADENTEGPASFVIADPDGNPILIDQHV